MASPRATLRVEGLKEMDSALKRLGVAFRTEVINGALLDAAEPIREEAARLASRSDTRGGTYGHGHAADHINKKLTRDGEVMVGPENKFWYLVFDEFGTPHQPANAPFRRAADSKFEEAVGKFRDTMAEAVRKNVR